MLHHSSHLGNLTASPCGHFATFKTSSKNYFRPLYKAYSISSDANLRNLHDRLVSGSYEPTCAIKLFFPKPSGMQRIYTLLSLEDHIVYQALVNVIAEKLYPVVKKRYLHSVFGNLYANQRSRFLYRDWRECYVSFANAIRKAFSDGYEYTVSFDLTACYDSIDHAVLKRMLSEIGISHELCDRLCELLSNWSSSSSQQPIYQGHGIPQGPLPSGILSECVLRYFNDHSLGSSSFRYFRYVDDIRLFAKSEHQLRKQLINLDMQSKEIGLFPQSSKIDLHHVTNIEEEVKSISHPLEPIAAKPNIDQVNVQRRLIELSPRLHVDNTTRFKYVLARAAPQAKLSKRLLVIVQRQPHLFESIFYYFSRAGTLSQVVSNECISVLKQNDLYSAFSAALIRALIGHIHPSCEAALLKYCQTQLLGASRSKDTGLRVAAASMLLQESLMKWKDINSLFDEADWWTKAYLAQSINMNIIGEPSYQTLLNKLLRDPSIGFKIIDNSEANKRDQ
jgi:Reverse transcriptase (RNA-dependent DNA polymerase)